MWLKAKLLQSEQISSNMKKLVFSVPGFGPFKAGQHVDIRLTAPDGYQAERSYSIANFAPIAGPTSKTTPSIDDIIELGVELLENGEVSPFLWSMNKGEEIEIRGPIGGHFIWPTETDSTRQIILIAGGSGIVPLISIFRTAKNAAVGSSVVADVDTDTSKNISKDFHFLVSMRDIGRMPYIDELSRHPIILTCTEKPADPIKDRIPDIWSLYNRRIDEDIFRRHFGQLVDASSHAPSNNVTAYICGPNGFVAAASSLLVKIGFSPDNIKTERFG